MIEGLLESVIRHGTLRVLYPDGTRRSFGGGEPVVTMRLHQPSALRRIGRDPEFMLGHTYMDQAWEPEGCDLRTLLQVLLINFPQRPTTGPMYMLERLISPLLQVNRLHASLRNAAHHYDLDEALFRLFLDEDMQYSCAYFAPGVTSLEQAQRAKCDHILRKLHLRPGQRVLDIGCGWGGLAMHLAKYGGANVTGLTLSREQARVARARVAECGLQQQVQILVQDYRDHQDHYDRIVSVGMFEHVGKPNYGRFFKCIREHLDDDGVAMLHTIGRSSPPRYPNPWLRRYIFPGGYIPALSEVMKPLERSGLLMADVEVLRLHYAETLAEWYRRFQVHRDQVKALHGERFCRMWEFYLAACEGTFRWRDLLVFQLQLSRQLDTLPRTRDYLYGAPPRPEGVGRPENVPSQRSVAG